MVKVAREVEEKDLTLKEVIEETEFPSTGHGDPLTDPSRALDSSDRRSTGTE